MIDGSQENSNPDPFGMEEDDKDMGIKGDIVNESPL